MEEGSLLPQALKKRQQHHQVPSTRKCRSRNIWGGDDDHDHVVDHLDNTLVVDVYVLRRTTSNNPSSSPSKQEVPASIRYRHPHDWIRLAQVGQQLNQYLQSQFPHTPLSHEQDPSGKILQDDKTLASRTTSEPTPTRHSNRSYPWWMGGDGPVFGVHVTEGVPHLRAVCRYGISVRDEWQMIGIIMDWTRSRTQPRTSDSANTTASIKASDGAVPAPTTDDEDVDVMVECWDIDDGQVMLIQGAEVLPPWMDQIGPDHCRHRCWIHRGQVYWIEPTTTSTTPNTDLLSSPRPSPSYPEYSLSLIEAIHVWGQYLNLSCLRPPSTPPSSVEHRVMNRVALAPESFQRILHQALHCRGPWYHVTAVALPRRLAQLFHQRPDLLLAAGRAFWEQASAADPTSPIRTINSIDRPRAGSRAPSRKTHLPSSCLEDWVWTTLPLGRTQFAMLRHLQTESTEAIPERYQSAELSRLSKQGAVDSTPHLHHAVSVGVRLMTGLDHLLEEEDAAADRKSLKRERIPKPEIGSMSAVERRIYLYWTRIITSCGLAQEASLEESTWLQEAWEQGPNHAMYDIDPIRRCPVFDEEVAGWDTPWTHPEQSLASQILQEVGRNRRPDDEMIDPYDSIPGPDDVDSEDWMEMPTDEEMQRMTGSTLDLGDQNKNRKDQANPSAPLDDLMHDMEAFMHGSSSIEGVAHNGGRQGAPTPTLNDREKQVVAAEVDQGQFEEGAEEDIVINPTVFLNMLHAVLRAESVDDLAFLDRMEGGDKNASEEDADDPYFHQEDYDIMDPELEVADQDGDEEGPATLSRDLSMLEMMEAMDEELKARGSLSRTWNDPGGFSSQAVMEGVASGEADHEHIHVVSNLIQSLEAQAGGSGPVSNMLRGMGQSPPKLEFS